MQGEDAERAITTEPGAKNVRKGEGEDVKDIAPVGRYTAYISIQPQ